MCLMSVFYLYLGSCEDKDLAIERRRYMCYGFSHDDVIKWKTFPRHRPFVRGIHRSPVNSPHKDQWRGALMFDVSLIYAWINSWVNNRDLRRHSPHYDVTVMTLAEIVLMWSKIADTCVYRIMHDLSWITMFCSRMRWFGNDFHEWRRRKSSADHITND